MKNLKYILLFTLSAFVMNSCSNDDDDRSTVNYVTFESTEINFPVDIGSSNTNDVIIFSSQESSSERTFDVMVNTEDSSADPASYSVPATVTIPANSNKGMLSITVTDINIGGGGETLILDLIPTDGLYVGAPITLNISQVCDFPVIIDIVFDAYASETSWEITDSLDATVTEGGGYTDGDASYSKSLCLADGTYTLYVYDSWGDGLDGSVVVSQNGVDLVTIPGFTGTETSVEFTVSN